MTASRVTGRTCGLFQRVLIVATIAGSTVLATAQSQRPTFRSTVELIAVDVQVIDQGGNPVRTLGPADFEVSVGGRTRRVLTADLVQYDRGQFRSTDHGPGGVVPASAEAARTFVLAIDAASFTVQSWARLKDTVRGFVERLQPGDRVGLYGYPGGPRIDPAVDHAAVSRAIASIAGQRHPIQSRFNLTPSEAIDIVSDVTTLRSPSRTPTLLDAFAAGTDTPSVAKVQSRECPADVTCPAKILMDATSLVNEFEAQVSQTVSGLQSLLRLVATYPGRKTVVLVSGGTIVSDRPGARPEVDNIVRILGHEVAQANAALYTLHLDSGFLDIYSAETRRVDSPGETEQRSRDILSRWLGQFSTAAGGTLLSVPAGSGAAEFGRVLQETSAYYLLGVEPAAGDRDGRLRELKVKIPRRGLTVRARTWVIVPPR
jgi:VWFA-related protein